MNVKAIMITIELINDTILSRHFLFLIRSTHDITIPTQSNSIIPSTIVSKMSYDVKISKSKMTANVRSATIKAHQYFNIIFFMLKLEFSL